MKARGPYCVATPFAAKIVLREAMTKLTLTLSALAALLTSAPAFAAAPQPIKPVPPQLYSGRWYEIARTKNMMQGDCQAGTSDFSALAANGSFSVTQTCRQGSPAGPKQVISASGHVLPQSGFAKMKLGMLGGLVTQEYWIVDHADNNAWAIMDRSDGRYVWLLSRQPVLTAADQAAALSRMRQLGFDMTRVVLSQQPPR